MQETEVKKAKNIEDVPSLGGSKTASTIKTLLDFEETDESFEDVVRKCAEACDGEWIQIPEDTEWTDQQIEDFSNMVFDTAEIICHTLIGKNLKYHSAYWWVRKACKEKYGNASIPYFVHTYEKTLRCGTANDDEDAEIDLVAYHLLEYVCKKLEEKWKSCNCDAEDLIEKVPVKEKKCCAYCGNPITNSNIKYCSRECQLNDVRKPKPEPVMKIKMCKRCGNPVPFGRQKFCSDE